MPKLTKKDLDLLKQYAQKQGFEKGTLEQEKRVYELLTNPQNASEITSSLSADDLFSLIDSATGRILPLEKWSTAQKVALVKKDIRFFSYFSYSFPGHTFNDQALLKECLKAFNKKYVSEAERKNQYYFNFNLSFRHIAFNAENLEIFIKSLPEQSPFIFEEYPFNQIQNWRGLIKSNPKLAVQSRMLDAIDTLNVLSKSQLEEFIKKNSDLLKYKVFYNKVVQMGKKQVLNKIAQEEKKAAEEIANLAEANRFDEADKRETDFEEYRRKALAGMKELEIALGPIQQNLLQQNRKQTSTGVSES